MDCLRGSRPVPSLDSGGGTRGRPRASEGSCGGDRREGNEDPAGPDPGVQGPPRTGAQEPARRRGLELPGRRPVPGVPRARTRLPGLGRGRLRVHGLPRRLRRERRGPRASEDRGGDPPRGRPRDPLRSDHREHGGAGGGDLLTLPARSDAVRELRDRGHHGRDPRGPRRHRPRQDHQDGGLLPRAPRLGAVLRRPRGRRPGHASRRGAREGLVHHGADLQGRAAGAVGHGHRLPVQRRIRRAGGLRRQPGRGGGRDPGAGDDEHRPRGAAARLPAGAARRVRGQRRRADLRRGQVRWHHRLRRHHRALRRRSRTSPPTRRRSAAARPPGHSAARHGSWSG